VSDDQEIAVGYAYEGRRAGYRPLEQALANEFAVALQTLRSSRPDLGLGPDGKVLVVVRDRSLAGISISGGRARLGKHEMFVPISNIRSIDYEETKKK
jgi:S-adenosylmethionine synthetase